MTVSPYLAAMVSTFFSVLHLPALIAWLEKFKAWLGEKLDALTGGGDLVIDGDVDLTYTDEDGENKSISVLGIIAAFAWWKQVADIGKT